MSRNSCDELIKSNSNHINQLNILENDMNTPVNLHTTLRDNFLSPKEQGKRNTGSLITYLNSKSGIPLIVVGPNCIK